MLLSIAVIVLNKLFPAFPVLTLITILSFLLALVVLVIRNPSTAIQQIGGHIATGLPNIYRELMLFLAAGVMSTGISTLLLSSDTSLGIADVSPLVAGGFILAAMLFSLVGVHPIITISIVGSLLINTSYNVNLLGVAMMMMWGNSIVASPFSGVNLTLQGRFGTSSFSIMRWNLGYAFTMLIVCVLALSIYSYTNAI